MFFQLKILSLFQLSEKFRLRDYNSTNKKLALIGRTIASMAIAYGCFIVVLLLLQLPQQASLQYHQQEHQVFHLFFLNGL